MLKSKRVIVAPLDWGLGHAARCIPIIKLLIEHGTEVILASNGRAFILLQKEFPSLRIIKIPAYNIKYYSNNMGVNIFLQFPKLVTTVIVEYFKLKKLVEQYNVDIVISDNRFGCFHKRVKTIFITHQLNIQLPKIFNFLSPIVKRINHFFIRKFDECWIPDFEIQAESLTGSLAHPAPDYPHKYIGPLSRMKFEKINIKREILVLLSGPEPQRTRLEKVLISGLKSMNKEILLIQGKPNELGQKDIGPKFKCQSFMTTKALNQTILESEVVICRSGYTSIMDLSILGKKAILIPTPGQTEQEYLANALDQKGLFIKQDQEGIQQEQLFQKIEYLRQLESLKLENSSTVLEEAIENLIST